MSKFELYRDGVHAAADARRFAQWSRWAPGGRLIATNAINAPVADLTRSRDHVDYLGADIAGSWRGGHHHSGPRRSPDASR